VNIGNTLNQEQISNIVRQGQGSMPGFPRLSNADLNSLVAYLLNPVRAFQSAPAATTLSTTAAKSPVATPSGTARYVSGFGFMFTSTGLSPIAPPWSSLTAYDLNEGTIKWKIPLGDVPELAAKGIKDTGSLFPKVGPVVTAGGLIFTGTRDRKVRALDETTGKVLWETELDAALEGIPAVYEFQGREYLVVCAAAAVNPVSQGKIHGAYVAFSLPKTLQGDVTAVQR
jgi:quinoprotein glucose dehydrogenase